MVPVAVCNGRSRCRPWQGAQSGDRSEWPERMSRPAVRLPGFQLTARRSTVESPSTIVGCSCVHVRVGRREWPGTWSPATRGPSWPSPVVGGHVCVGRSRCHGNGSLPVARCPLLTRRTGCGSDPGDRTIGAGSAGISETTPGQPVRRRRLPGGGTWRAAEGCASDPSRGSESHGRVYENNPCSSP